MVTKEKKVQETVEATVVEEKPSKKVSKSKKVEVVETSTSKATVHDFDVILEPLITEKTMSQTQEDNKATFKVKKGATKPQIRNAIQRIYGVKVTDVKVVNVIAKKTTRGSKYHGMISGFKKAIVTIEKGQAIDLFKE